MITAKDNETVKSTDEESSRSARLLMVQKLCYDPDPETCFCNCIKLHTNRSGRLLSFGTFSQMFIAAEFDKTLNINIQTYMVVFRQHYNGFSRKFKSSEAKRSFCYGPGAFVWTLEKLVLQLEDYQWTKKRQTILLHEFAAIAHVITNKCLHDDAEVLLSNSYFLGKYKQTYKKQTGRILNEEKLQYITSILHNRKIIIEAKIGIKHKKHIRNIYSLGEENPFYRNKYQSIESKPADAIKQFSLEIDVNPTFEDVGGDFNSTFK